MPEVSVVIPARDRETLIARALGSVLRQTFDDLEVIVVDDGSTDRTAEVAASTGDPRVRVVRHVVGRGAQAARNTGVRQCRGRYVAFLDSDDEWLPDKLAMHVAALALAPAEVGVAVDLCRQRFADGSERELAPRLAADAYASLLAEPGVPFILVVRRSCLEAIGELDETIVAYQEWDLCIRLARLYRFIVVPRALTIYHSHGNARISDHWGRSARGYLQVVTKHQEEIRRVLGRAGLARHHLRAAAYSLRGGDAHDARKIYLRSLALDPMSWRAWAYAPLMALGRRAQSALDRVRDGGRT